MHKPVLTWTTRLRRYVNFDPNDPLGTSQATAAAAEPIAPPTGRAIPSSTASVGKDVVTQQVSTSPKAHKTTTEPNEAQDWSVTDLVDPHLSGSDPRMFPGVVTRGQRRASLLNLAGAADVAPPTGEHTNA